MKEHKIVLNFISREERKALERLSKKGYVLEEV